MERRGGATQSGQQSGAPPFATIMTGVCNSFSTAMETNGRHRKIRGDERQSARPIGKGEWEEERRGRVVRQGMGTETSDWACAGGGSPTQRRERGRERERRQTDICINIKPKPIYARQQQPEKGKKKNIVRGRLNVWLAKQTYTHTNKHTHTVAVSVFSSCLELSWANSDLILQFA